MNAIVNKLKVGFADRQYEILVFIVLTVELFMRAPLPFDKNFEFHPAFLFSYDILGFVSRSFIGSIVKVIYCILYGRDAIYISKEFIWFFVFFSLILINVIVSALLAKVIKKADEKMKLNAICIVILYLANPFCASFLFSPALYGSVNLFVVLWMLLAVIVIQNQKLLWILPIISFCAIATHLVSVFYFVPVILIMAVYDIYTNKKDKSILFFIITFLIISISAFYFIVISPQNLKYNTIEQVIMHLPNSDTTFDYLNFAIRAEFFYSVIDHFNEWILSGIPWLILYLFYAIIFYMPLIALILYFWVAVIREEKDKNKRFIFLLSCAGIFICNIPCFVFFNDYPRWLSYFFTTQFIFIFYYLYSKEESVIFAIKKIRLLVQKHMFVSMMLIVYLLAIGRVNADASVPMFVNSTIKMLKYLLSIIY